MIQPGLMPLQPNLDFMDTFEPFQDLFSSSRSIFGSMLPAPASAAAPDPNSPPAQVERAWGRGTGLGNKPLQP